MQMLLRLSTGFRPLYSPGFAFWRLAGMLKSPFEPCVPTRATDVPAGPDWIHEIKHDGLATTC